MYFVAAKQKHASFVYNYGPRKSGKTTAAAKWALERMKANPGSKMLLIASTFSHASVCMSRIAEEANNQKLNYKVNINWIKLENGSSVQAVPPNSCKGTYVDFVVIDEKSKIKNYDALWPICQKAKKMYITDTIGE